MKIENITIHRNCNYGSVLQTYATQKTFEDFGFECVVESSIIAQRQYADTELRMKRLGGIAYNITHGK